MSLCSELVVSCVHPIRVVNPRYRKYGDDLRFEMARQFDDYYITAPCGRCVLCRKKRSTQWRLRLINEFEITGKTAFFLTLTFNSENYHLRKDLRTLVRRWRQNFQYHYGVAPRYFLVEDKGTQNGRLHLHGILFAPPCSLYDFRDKHHAFWPYGFVSVSRCRSVKAMSYCAGYVAGLHPSDVDADGNPTKHGKKVCSESLRFIPKTYVSKGLGKACAQKLYMFAHYDNDGKQRLFPFYKVGGKVYPLPRYYKQILFDDAERGYLKEVYLKKIHETLFDYKDREYMLRYVVNGRRVDEHGKFEQFRQYISVYEDKPEQPVEIQEDCCFEKSFIYECNLTYNL